MNDLQQVSPETMGICPQRWKQVLECGAGLCRSGRFPALALQVQRRGQTTGPHYFGTTRLGENVPVTDETIFLVASLTKPMIALATLLLVERGQLSLNQQVRELMPEVRDAAKRPMTIRHLLTHTSGLPDMLPDNAELRIANAPLAQFVAETCEADLVFPPGRSAQYQSMGYAWLGEIIERISGLPCRDFLEQEIFLPLKMKRSWLGLPPGNGLAGSVAEIQLASPMKEATTGNWNSRYWQELGAPWGGVLSNCHDLSRFLRLVLGGVNQQDGPGLLTRVSLLESLGNRLEDFPSIPGSERRTRGWGLGWRLNWKDHRSTFCDLLPAEVAGHWGATGTLFWLDVKRDLGVVLLSTRPLEEGVSPLTHLSNMIVGSFIDL